MMRSIFLSAIALALATGSAFAQERVAFSRAVFVEQKTAPGLRAVTPATTLRRGDKVVMVVEWSERASSAGRWISSAVPKALTYQRSSRDNLQVSINDGRSWGVLGSLKVTDRDGTRLASPEDVTHLRWRISATNPGRMTYSAIVR